LLLLLLLGLLSLLLLPSYLLLLLLLGFLLLLLPSLLMGMPEGDMEVGLHLVGEEEVIRAQAAAAAAIVPFKMPQAVVYGLG
jgi:hypothetical protein